MSAVEDVHEKLRGARPLLWTNPAAGGPTRSEAALDIAVDAAEARLRRAEGLLRLLFPALTPVDHPIHSPLLAAEGLAMGLGEPEAAARRWWIKADHQLPIAGSVKARGGFHEVIAFAERLALEAGLLKDRDDLAVIGGRQAKALFSRYSVVVGSTGNLGMGIGLISSALGFRAIVHMSSDAKTWKKQRLRDHGVIVIEHQGDYALAVENGRQAAIKDPFAHFVDDEHSVDLLVGYAAAAKELAAQLEREAIVVDPDHPLFVYIPCGVGGAPGGVTYGLKRLFDQNVHCFFAEPVQSPCMLVQLLAPSDEPVSVYDIGLTNRTEADGLAVGQASLLVAPLMRTRLDGVYTVSDDQLYALFLAGHAQNLRVEPSAAAAFAGPLFVTQTRTGRDFLDRTGLASKLSGATHVLWTTGGSLVPTEERQRLLQKAAGVSDFSLTDV
jgi:D-serine dehydratase